MQNHVALKWQAFALPKRGHHSDEYEDAFAGDPEAGRFAVADGASESSYANLWAKLLVEGFVNPNSEKTTAGTWLDALGEQWAQDVDGRSLQGACATFLGLSILRPRAGHSGRWKCLAVGDSCLFQVRQDQLIAAFPLSRAADFNNRPSLLNSRGGKVASPRQKTEWGKWHPGDQFFLMTDAIAQWFLTRHAGKRAPWQSLARRLSGSDAALVAYVEDLRDRKEMRNDDVTLVVVSPLK